MGSVAGTIVAPAGEVRGTVRMDGQRIVAVDAAGPDRAVPERYVVPGFVDLQVNGHEDVDCATAEGADWELLDRLLLAQGVTTWCPTLVTAPLETYTGSLGRIAAAAARPAHGRRCVAGAHLEGPFLGGAPGAHNRDWLVPIDLGWIDRLPQAVKVLTLAPELAGAGEAVRLLTSRGVLVGLGHSTCTYEEAEAAADAGARLVTHLFNGMAPLHHRRPGLAGAALADARLTPSLIADGVHVHPAVLRAAMAATPCILVTDAVARRRPHGGQGVTVTDAPRLDDGTLAGTALTMDRAIRTVAVPLQEAVAAVSARPAALLWLHDRGRVEPGLRADLVALTPGLDVEQVWVGGEPAL